MKLRCDGVLIIIIFLLLFVICASNCRADGMTVIVSQSQRMGFSPQIVFKVDKGLVLQILYRQRNEETKIINCEGVIPHNPTRKLTLFASWFRNGRKIIHNVETYTVTIKEKN